MHIKIDWTPLGSYVPQCENNFITTLDPYTGNQYTYKNHKRPTDNRMAGHTDILYFHSGYLKPQPAAACAAHNYSVALMIAKKRHRQTNIEMEKHTYKLNWTPVWEYSTTVGIILHNLCRVSTYTARNYGPRFYDHQKVMWKTKQRYRENKRRGHTYKLPRNPLGSFGP